MLGYWITFIVLFVSATTAHAQSVQCDRCSPEIVQSLEKHLDEAAKKFPQLVGIQVKGDLRLIESINAYFVGGKEVQMFLHQDTTPTQAWVILSHELGHAVFTKIAAEAGLGAIDEADAQRFKRSPMIFTQEEWPLIQGSCKTQFDLIGLNRSFQELAADTFSYYINDQNPIALAQVLEEISKGSGDARRFDYSISDEDLTKHMDGKPADWLVDPYAALSQCKKVVRDSGITDGLAVLRAITERYKKTWLESCGTKTFQELREELRQDLEKQVKAQ